MKSDRESAAEPAATVRTLSRDEASAAVGFAIGDANDAAQAARRLAGGPGCGAVAITLDAGSASPHLGERPWVLAVLAVGLGTDCVSRTPVHLHDVAAEGGAATATCVCEAADEIVRQYGTGDGKVRSLSPLLTELARRRRTGQTVVFTNGCFDVIHRGHVEYLQFCKRHGDIVVVGLNSDSSVRALKGPQRPINHQDDRAAVLAGLEAVDFVTLFEELNPLNLIGQVRPDVLVKGADWSRENVVGGDFVESYGGKVVLAPLVEGKSSTATIRRIRAT